MRITTNMIEELRFEAIEHRDDEQARLCELALEGDAEAWDECARVIREAKGASVTTWAHPQDPRIR
jgi:hypothetical protein